MTIGGINWGGGGKQNYILELVMLMLQQTDRKWDYCTACVPRVRQSKFRLCPSFEF